MARNDSHGLSPARAFVSYPPRAPRGPGITSRGIMWFCIGSCIGVCGAWNWSSGAIPGGTPQQRSKLYRFLVQNFMIKLEDVQANRWWNLITPAFSHIALYHLLGNLFSFHAFSSILLLYGLTPLRYGSLILGSAVAGHLGFLYQEVQRRSQTHAPSGRSALGLSGVVMGVGSAAALVAPKAKMLVMGVVPMPMWALMGLYVLWDSYALDSPTSKVGHAAHLGGAAFGVAYYVLALRRGSLGGRRPFRR